MAQARTQTLIMCTNVSAVRQWIAELLDKTSLSPDEVGEYSGQKKEVRPVTVTTYQILTYRKSRQGPFEHMQLMKARNWGLLIYDEVHVVPAPVFRATTDSGKETPRPHSHPDPGRRPGRGRLFARGSQVLRRALEGARTKGFIAQACCYEIRLPLPKETASMRYPETGSVQIASENTLKER